MGKESENKKENTKQTRIQSPFHQRFNIKINFDKAKGNFSNRVQNEVEASFPELRFGIHDTNTIGILRQVANALGTRYESLMGFDYYAGRDFYHFLKALEALYQALPKPSNKAKNLDRLVQSALSQSETDLGVRWREGIFLPSGAKLLDEALVNENLKWLSAPHYANVLAPFEKALRHFLEANKYPERLADAITDMYEALEAMAKVVTDRPKKDLSANRELFVKKLGLSDYYKKMLQDYISYASEFRHAAEEGKERVPPLTQEVEAFIYTTGLFIRLAIERLATE